jgi:hypothetical protein
VPNQFQVTLAGFGGSGQQILNGFYLDSLLLPTVEGAASANDPRNIRMFHVPVLVNDLTLRDPVANVNLTLDGIFGMNLLTATQLIPDPNDPLNIDFVRGAFDYVAYDQVNSMLGLSLNKDFHISGDFDLNGRITNADLQGMLAAIKDLNAFAAANGLSSANALALADINQDGVVNAADVQMLMSMLTQSSSSPLNVPEPATWLLVGMAICSLRAFRTISSGRN